MGKLISVQEAARRLGVCDETVKNWAKAGHIQLKGMGQGARKFWVDEDVIAAISSDVKEIEKAKACIAMMRSDIRKAEYEITDDLLDVKMGLRLIRHGDVMAMRRFLESFVTAMHHLDVINEQEERVLLMMMDENTVEKIGTKEGLTRARVLQIYGKATDKIAAGGDLKALYEEAEAMRQELASLREINKSLGASLMKVNEKEAELSEMRTLRDRHGDEFAEEYACQKELCEKFLREIRELDLSTRCVNALQAGGIKTVGDLCRMNIRELLKFRNMGRKAVNEVWDCLEAMGLKFQMDVDVIMARWNLLRQIAEEGKEG